MQNEQLDGNVPSTQPDAEKIVATDIIVDIESAGMKPGCVVFTAGLTAFNTVTGTFVDTVKVVFPAAQQIMKGLTFDIGTMEWYLEKRIGKIEEMRASMSYIDDLRVPAQAVHEFIKHHKEENKDLMLWGNDAGFDLDILEAVMQLVPGCTVKQMEYYKYGNLKTLRDIYSRVFGYQRIPKVNRSLQHEALYDSNYEASIIIEFFREMEKLKESAGMIPAPAQQ